MLERILENWLDKASEKSFQLPFCFMLANEGHTILHLTRHTITEYGKDVVTINPEGEICAYQLKGAPGGRIGYDKYRNEILPQFNTLTGIPVIHPSVSDNSKPHRSYFVTNGYLEEEVAIAISNANSAYITRNRPDLVVETIVRGQLLDMAKRIKLEILPTDLKDFNLFLELYLEDGSGMLKKEKLARLYSTLYAKTDIRLRDKRELIASVAIITSLVMSNHANENNHLALVEAWTMFIAYTYRFIEANNLEERYYKQELQIAQETIINELEEFYKEIIEDPHLLHAIGPAENLIYNAKLTWLSGFIAYLGIFYEKTGEGEKALNIACYLDTFQTLVDPYGEAAFAPLLSVYWLKRITDATLKPLFMLETLFNTVMAPVGAPYLKTTHFLPDPYQGVEICVADRYLKEKKIENTKFDSYYAESLLHLITRENHKQFLRWQWPAFSRIHLKSFNYRRPTDFYLWRASEGDEVTRLQQRTRQWGELRSEALAVDVDFLPAMIKKVPIFIPLMLLVYPHRVNTELVKFFEVWVRDKSTVTEQILR